MDANQKSAEAPPVASEKGKSGTPRQPRFRHPSKRGECRFCRDKVRRIDYKDVSTLQGLLRGQGRIMSRQRSGNCARHQRMAKLAIKRARFLAFLGYIEGPPRRERSFGRDAW